LNEDEIKKLNEELEASDINDVLRLIEGTTSESLDQIQEEINFFLEEKDEKEEQEKQKDSSNPFKALIGGYGEEPTKSQPKSKVSVPTSPGKVIMRSETFAEKNYVRPLGEEKAKELAFNLFDFYKKAHGMPSYT
jgi:hypothetical protein